MKVSFNDVLIRQNDALKMFVSADLKFGHVTSKSFPDAKKKKINTFTILLILERFVACNQNDVSVSIASFRIRNLKG